MSMERTRVRMPANLGWLGLLVMGVCACATPQLPEVSPATKRELLSGEVLFGTEVAPAEPIAIQDTSPEMERFLAPLFEIDSRRERLRQLVRHLAEVGLLNARYDERLTLSAAATLEAKAGNCLSYTNMFVTLARRLGLRARFQRVAVPPTWGMDGDLLIRSNHINAVVPNMRNTGLGQEFVMDFNYVAPESSHERWLVTDAHAFALMYANLSVDALMRGQQREAFAWLKRTLVEDPDNADHWVNLGVIYARAGATDLAEAAFTLAYRMTWRRQSAMAGLATLYRQTGDAARAHYYEEKIRRLRARDPFYHLAIGRAAYDKGAYEDALPSFRRAIQLRPRTGVFHFMKGLALLRLGDEKRGLRGLRMATRYGQVDDYALRYRSDLEEFLDVDADDPNARTIARVSSGFDLYERPGFAETRID